MATIACFRVTIPDAPSTITIPSLGNPNLPKKVIVRNVGTGLFANAFRFNFPGDSSSNYIELAPSTAYPHPIGGLRGGEVINTDGIGGSAQIEIVIWEEY